jgi:hypothetical protein
MRAWWSTSKRASSAPRYGHMAIHPYPIELEGEIACATAARCACGRSGPRTRARERLLRRAVGASRYQRFMQYLPQPSERMLARFTQLDYDRELALAALWQDEFVAVGRYAPNQDGLSAEFALVVADDWQGKGSARAARALVRGGARRRLPGAGRAHPRSEPRHAAARRASRLYRARARRRRGHGRKNLEVAASRSASTLATRWR